MFRSWIAPGLALVLVACDSGEPQPTARSGPTGEPISSAVGASPAALAMAPTVRPAPDPNPLRLPPRRVKLDPGRRVFTFSDTMLASARPGSTLVLYAATVSGFDGDDLIIEGRAGPSYKVHAGYVIPVPDDPKLRHGDPVLTEWNGVMKHAVVTKLTRDRVAVRYTDMDPKTPEAQLKNARFVRQVDGLVPGNYAALSEGGSTKHVLLVSPAIDGDERRWFVLGFGGAAMVVDEASLKPIPVKFDPRPGSPVLAEWIGTMRKATVVSANDGGQFSVRFERAGRPATVGWGQIMRDPDAPKSSKGSAEPAPARASEGAAPPPEPAIEAPEPSVVEAPPSLEPALEERP